MRNPFARPDPPPSFPVQKWPAWVAHEPEVLAPHELMIEEGVELLEHWFRWAEEWSMLLRVYGRITAQSRVLEIGCGCGRIAYALLQVLTSGTYDGFDIRRAPIEFLQRNFQSVHPNFRFHLADLNNTFYNPNGTLTTAQYAVPAADASIDIVYEASVFTHMLPENTLHYFREASRVLRPGGRCVFSFFLLDHYVPGRTRPLGFARPHFDFDHRLAEYGDDFATVVPSDPERMTAYRLSLVRSMAEQVGLEVEGEPVPGLWSGSFEVPIGMQDLVILRKPGA
ncbi:class I SAM-dependent methyltransferase [Rubellimicrobium roseum]|uniref:Methyltransferase domain-containing protein n=1 Tax=Rubellimicrobium roseum TaxID=687525 RepID=A0A5C4NHH7_9RHOB|nr:class I SAM-dependent methyltransferase [Rubellimicrobium roseum]TNC74073.1 methyltransferase domain-containing protein [Rubellimicrobium roseum]